MANQHKLTDLKDNNGKGSIFFNKQNYIKRNKWQFNEDGFRLYVSAVINEYLLNIHAQCLQYSILTQNTINIQKWN